MILIKCPDCKKDISANTLNCVYCGRSINSLDDFRMRFQTLMEDIKYTKGRQWTITYYLLLLYSGLIALDHGFEKICCGQELYLVAFGGFILFFGWQYLDGLIKSITEYREYLFIDILPKLAINEPEINTLKLRYKTKLTKERDKRKRRKESFNEDDERQFVIDLHLSGKDSKLWRFRTILILAFVLQIFFLKNAIPFIKDISSRLFNC
jgi:hypothetical protein